MNTDKHGKWTIEFNVAADKWHAKHPDGNEYSSASRAELIKRIDAWEAKLEKEPFTRFKVLTVSYGDWSNGKPRIVEHEVTSRTEKYGTIYHWITNLEDKKRSTSRLSNYFADTAKNRTIMADMVEIIKQAKELDRKADVLKEKLEIAGEPKGKS